MSSQVIDGWKPIRGTPGKTIVTQNSDGSYTVTIDPSAIGDGSGDMLKAVYDIDGNDIVDAAESVPWGGVTGKPLVFPPDEHTHSGSDVTSQVSSAASADSVPWTGVTGKPLVFPPDVHTHDDRYYTESEIGTLLGGYVLKTTFDANSLLIANTDDTPVALSVGASTLVGRAASGGIAALSASQVATIVQGSIDHGSITGLADDDHAGYARLAGRSGGQTLIGGTADNDDLTLEGTSNATRTTSYVVIQPNGGNVGIGTTSPSSLLTINGSTRTQSLITGDSTVALSGTVGNLAFVSSVSAPFTSYHDSDGARIGFIQVRKNNTTRIANEVAQDMTFSTNSTEHMRITSGGLVGIGTAPTSRLHVMATTQDAIQTVTYMGALNSLAQSKGFLIRTRADNSDPLIVFRTDASAGTDPKLGFSVGSDTPALTVISGGNVGIGTTSPVGKLHIGATTGVGSPGSIALSIRDASSPTYGFDFNLEGVLTGDLSLMRTDLGTQFQVMTFQRSSGNVGIGTTSPSRKLHVAGTILIDGDEGGIAGTIGLTDVNDLAARSTGVGTIKFNDATNRDSSGFVKIYIGVTEYYIPVFAAI